MTSSQLSLADGPAMPQMREAILTAEDVDSMLADWKAHTQLLHVSGKGRLRTQVGDSTILSVDGAVEQLISGQLLAIQVRYRFDSYQWTDTLLNAPGGFRLVRCRHECE